MSPLCKDLFQTIKQLGNCPKESGRSYHLSTPKSPNKGAIGISPAQNDSFSGFQKDDFQLKNESDHKHSKMIEFPYPETLLSKSNSSKKEHLKKILKDGEMGEQEGLKRRLFEKESMEYDMDESSNYNPLPYNESMSYVDNLITPPPKNQRKPGSLVTDQKLSGVKYYQADSVEKFQQIENHGYMHGPGFMPPQMIPQVNYKSRRNKHLFYSYLIPFCNKCNLPPVLPDFRDFEMEMVNPVPMPQPMPMPSSHSYTEKDHISAPSVSGPMVKTPKSRQKPKKKPSVDENGKRIIRRRKRKTYEQLQMLIKEFQANPEWSKENMQEVSRKTGLSEAQVYKWGWDQKRKMMDPNHDIHAELRLYKKQQDEEIEEKASLRKLKLTTPSNKKSGKQGCDSKFMIKTRELSSSQKENRNSENTGYKLETRGVKRKLKALHVANRDMQV